MGRYCKQVGDYVDSPVCDECGDENCSYSPDYGKPDANKTLEKFRASEFASGVAKRLTTVFPMTEEEIVGHLDKLFAIFEKDVRDTVRVCVTAYLQRKTVQYMDAKLTTMLDSLFAEAVAEKLIMLTNGDGKAVMQTIRERAEARISSYLNSQKSDQRKGAGVGDPIQKQIESVVDQRVADAIAEIKTEAIERFNRDAMKKMMQGMAKAIGQDAKLMRLLTE